MNIWCSVYDMSVRLGTKQQWPRWGSSDGEVKNMTRKTTQDYSKILNILEKIRELEAMM